MPNTEEEIDSLIAKHRKLIDLEASKYAKFIPLSFVKTEAYRLAREAARKFDKSKGLQFSTYLTNSLQKLSRLSTQYGGTVRVPENKQFKINRLNQVETGLIDTYGRQPTISELSDASGMPISEVNSLLTARKKDVNLANLAYAPVFYDTEDDDWLHFVYHDLTPKDKIIFEHKTGFGGKPILDNAKIAKLVGLSPAAVSQRIKLFAKQIEHGVIK